MTCLISGKNDGFVAGCQGTDRTRSFSFIQNGEDFLRLDKSVLKSENFHDSYR